MDTASLVLDKAVRSNREDLPTLRFSAVEGLKQAGMSSRYAGIAAILTAITSIDGHARGELASNAEAWITTGFVGGLAAAGM